jgi:hypothetical protein
MDKIGAARVEGHLPAMVARPMNTRTWNAAQHLSKQLSPLLEEGDRYQSALQSTIRSKSSNLSTSAPAQSLNRRWIRQLVLADNTITPGAVATSVATDKVGNVYISGDINAGTSINPTDVFIAKYSTDGRQLWFKRFGSGRVDVSRDIAVDQKGNIYITGCWNGEQFSALSGEQDAFVAKYNASGRRLWFQKFGTQRSPDSTGISNTGYDSPYGIAADRKGNVYLTGFTDGDLAGTNAGGRDAWAAKYNTNGRQIWVKQFGTVGNDEAYGIASDLRGNIYLTGNTEGNLVRPNLGAEDAWVIKLNTNGRTLWQKQLGTAKGENSFNIALDRRGNAYITGATSGSLAAPNAEGEEEVWVAKYSVNGRLLWRRQFGDIGFGSVEGIAVDQAGSAYLTGYTDSNLFGDNAGTQGVYDAWIVKYTAEGRQTWSEQFGSSEFDASLDITVDRQGNVYTTGYTNGDLGNPNPRGLNAWVAKYLPG